MGPGRNTPARALSRTGSNRRRHSIDPRQLPRPRSLADSNGTSTRYQRLGAVIGGCRRDCARESCDWPSLRRDQTYFAARNFTCVPNN